MKIPARDAADAVNAICDADAVNAYMSLHVVIMTRFRRFFLLLLLFACLPGDTFSIHTKRIDTYVSIVM